MPVPSTLADLSTTASSNSPAATDAISNGDDYLRAIQALLREGDTRASTIASASTVDIGAAAGRIVGVSGTTTITSFGTVSAGIWRIVFFDGALTLTHNATSLILPSEANITTASGDRILVESLGSGNWVGHAYWRRSGAALIESSYTATGTGGTARTMSTKFADYINVKDYGAVADWNGSTGTDNATAFTNAVARAAALGGATVYVPAGAYKIASAIAITSKGIRIVGDGMYNTTIVKDGTSSSCFTFENAACDLCEVRDLRITKGASTHVSGIVFTMNTAGALGIKIERVLVEDVYSVLESKPGTLGVNDCIIRDCEWLRIEKYGIYLEYALNWRFDHIIISMNGTTANTAGVVLGSSTEGCNFSSVYCLAGEHGWYFANTLAGTAPKEHTFTHCVGDNGGTTAFYAVGLRRSRFLSCWASTQEANAKGVVFDGTDVYGVSWIGGEIVNVSEDAMQIINGAARIIVNGSTFANWGIEAATTHYGIQTAASAGTSFIITNNTFSDDADLGGDNAWIGVGVGAGTYTSYVITGNIGQSLVSSTVSDGGTASVGKTVSGNH